MVVQTINMCSMPILVFGPILFGHMWDRKAGTTDLIVRVSVILGGILLLLAYMFSWTRFYLIAGIFICIGTSPMHAFAYSSAGGYENKVAAMCVYNFYFVLA